MFFFLLINTNLRCGCGRSFEEHRKSMRIKPSGKDSHTNHEWRIKDHTELFPTNAFGVLEFQGADIHTTKAEVKPFQLHI